MKKNAWTMAEMTVAFIILMILAVIGINTIKPNNSQARIFVYATIRNLAKANAYLIEKYGEVNSVRMTVPDGNTDPYCAHVADMFSLTEAANCKKTGASTVMNVNIKFSNGVTIQGLASSWVVPYTNAEFAFKNIVVDVDGSAGMNRVGIDRFPLRIFKDSIYEGVIQGVNCNSDKFYVPDTNTSYTLDYTNGKNPYCKDGYSTAGTASTNNFLEDNSILAYDVYMPIEEAEISRVAVVATAISAAKADCGAYGGDGYFTRQHCNAMGYKMYDQCAQSDLCDECSGTGYNVCPPGASTPLLCNQLAAQNNTLDFSCFVNIAKPTGGLGMLTGALLNEIDI